jgi:hypothetical protein
MKTKTYIKGRKKPATKRKPASGRKGVQVGKINEARKPGWLYYVKGTSVMRSPMKRKKVAK